MVGAGLRRNVGLLAVVVVAAGVVGGVAGAWPVANEFEPHGKLTVHGIPVETDAVVVARIDGVVVDTGSVSAAGRYSLSIPQDDPAKAGIDGWRDGDAVVVYVDNEQARPTLLAELGSSEHNLTVQLASSIKLSTWGKIKALFR